MNEFILLFCMFNVIQPGFYQGKQGNMNYLPAYALELYKSEGIQYKEWISVQDDRTRDAHLLMDGTVIPVTDKFEVPATSQSEGAFMEYAGDPSAPAGQVANCRCTISAFVMM